MDGECCAESPFEGATGAAQDGKQWGDLNSMSSPGPCHWSRSSIALGALMVVGLMPMAKADTSVTAAAPSDELVEVVITAERTTQNLQKVPISATVLSGDQLENEGVHRVADLQLVAPSLSIATYNLSTFVNIRGVGMAQSAPTSTPGVAFYIDGAFIPHEFVISGAFYDLDAVEVLRGPQGTLTGQNSTGGAIYLRTPDPDFTKFSGFVDETVGNKGLSRAQGAVNLPIADDHLALRLSGTDERRGSFTDNIGSGAQPGDLRFDSVRADLGFKITPQLTGDLRFEYFNNHNDNTATKNPKVLPQDPFTIDQDGDTSYHIDGTRTDLELKYDITDNIRVRLLSDYQQSIVNDLEDGDRTATAPPQPPATNTGRLFLNNLHIHTQTDELDLIGTTGPLKWVAGVFYMDDTVDLGQNLYGRDTVVVQHPPTKVTAYNTANTSKSGFGQLTYEFDQFQFVGGLRYSEDGQTFFRVHPATATGDASSSEVTGKFAVNYFVTANTMTYATVSRGYKAGGVNPVAGTPNYGPETNLVEELGVKTTFLDQHLRINADVFHSDYDNLQLVSLTSARLPITQNLPQSRSNGMELEVQGHFSGWTLNLGAAYLDAKSATSVTLLNNTGPVSALGLVPDGTTLPYSPRWTMNGGVEYAFNLGNLGTLSPRLQWSHTNLQWASVYENPQSVQPGHDIFDTQLTWDLNRSLQVQAFVTNLGNKTYIASQVFNTSGANGGTIYGDRRAYGARVAYRF
jgi:iron complex outermembrane recepter protein